MTQAPDTHQMLSMGIVKAPTGVATKGTRFVASTSSEDRSGDVINQQGWELDNYRRNPVFLWAHEYDELPVGKSIDTQVRNGRLEIDIEWAEHEFAQTVRALYEGGFMSAVSVGFRVLEWSYDAERGGYNFDRVELLEVSAVPVPCNQDALMLAAKSSINVDLVRSWAQGVLKGFQQPVENVVDKSEDEATDDNSQPVDNLVENEPTPSRDEEIKAIELELNALSHRLAHVKGLTCNCQTPTPKSVETDTPEPAHGPRPVIRLITTPAQGADPKGASYV